MGRCFMRAGDDVFSGRDAQVGRQEPHGRPCCTDVDSAGHVLQGTEHDLRVVGVGKTCWGCCVPAQGIDNQRTARDALAGRQLYLRMESQGWHQGQKWCVIHLFFLNSAQSYEKVCKEQKKVIPLHRDSDKSQGYGM